MNIESLLYIIYMRYNVIGNFTNYSIIIIILIPLISVMTIPFHCTSDNGITTTTTTYSSPMSISTVAAFTSSSTVIAMQHSQPNHRHMTKLHDTRINKVSESLQPQPQPQEQQQQQQQQEQEQQEQLQHLVLIGGGHAHIQVIKALHSGIRPKYLMVTLIDMVESVSYSGMVPGCIAGQYTINDTQLKLRPLTEWSNIQFIHDTVIDIDLQRKEIYLLKCRNQPISFDVISIDIGSTSRGYTTCPGAIQYAIPTRPIDKLIYKLETARQQEIIQEQKRNKAMLDDNNDDDQPHSIISNSPRRLVVIGGGIAGIELSMSITSRYNKDNIPFYECIIIDINTNGLLPNETNSTRQIVQNILTSKNIHIQYGYNVTKIDQHYVYASSVLSDNNNNDNSNNQNIQIPYTLCIWSAGAGAHPLAHHLYTKRQLSCDTNGWIQVYTTLQSISHPYVFAAGDCATIIPSNNDDNNNENFTSPPKAGVYAVRSGPILIENLTRYLESIRHHRTNSNNEINGFNNNYNNIHDDNNNNDTSNNRIKSSSSSELSLLRYIPQNDFLKLVVCGDGTALGFRFGLVIQGLWVFRLKDNIDQSFMKLFDVSSLPKPVAATTNNHNNNNENGVSIGKYDTRQYDSTPISKPLLNPKEAAILLHRTDNDVDIEEAKIILKTMGNDTTYRNAVIEHFHLLEYVHTVK